MFIADLPRETANALVDSLMELGVQHEGTVTLTPVGTWISSPGLEAERRAPGRGPDSVVWAEVTERAYSETELTWTYVSFMILATLLAAIAIVTDSAILVIGAMVLGPEFVPIAALGLGMVRRRPGLIRQALRTLQSHSPRALDCGLDRAMGGEEYLQAMCCRPMCCRPA